MSFMCDLCNLKRMYFHDGIIRLYMIWYQILSIGPPSIYVHATIPIVLGVTESHRKKIGLSTLDNSL